MADTSETNTSFATATQIDSPQVDVLHEGAPEGTPSSGASNHGTPADTTYMLDEAHIAVNGPPSGKQVAISMAAVPRYVAGRRAWVKYRELGVTQATNGAMRAQVINAEAGDNQPTGWHLHRCDMQFLFGISGRIHIAFSPDHIVTLCAGDALMIPGGVIHQELGEPTGVKVLEVTIPAEIGTEAVDSPWGDREIDFDRVRAAADAAAEAA